jgi:hypothetical protein
MEWQEWQRMVTNLAGRIDGPMHFRILMQPAMALFFGIKDGVRDAREGRRAYFWAIFTDSTARARLLKHGLKSVGRILLLAIILDAIYQIIELHWFYPGEAIIVAVTLAFLPYLLIRGPVNRITTWRRARAASDPAQGSKR